MAWFYTQVYFVLTTATTLSLATILPATAASFRSIDGSDNNLTNSDWGATDTQLLRLTDPAYADGISEPRGGFSSSLPSARSISNTVVAQSGSILNSAGVTDWLWQWGQLLDHDLDLTETANPAEPFNVAVPTGDPFFDPFSTGTETIGLNRSLYDPTTGTSTANPRQQENQITAFIDASNVYGSDAVRAAALRSGVNGQLLTSTSDTGEMLLPFNTGGLANAGGTSSSLFLAGDVRANEQIGLTAAHTLFVREHNRLATDLKQRLDGGEAALVAKRDAAIAEAGNGIDDEDDFIYETARKVVGAEMQVITYEEFLPLLLGDGALDAFTGYDDTVNPSIANEFSTAAYRFGHTMLSPQLQRINNDGSDAGSVALQDAFFNPDLAVDDGIDSLLLGLASQEAQALDTQLVDDVRNFLFGPPGSGGFDLASLNIQRGRDHGLGSLNEVRNFLGLTPYVDFQDLTAGNTTLADAFASVYDSVDDVDLWVGGLAETGFNGGLLGETFHTIVADQFTRLRDGDRFFYLNPDQLDHLVAIDPNIQSTRLSDIIRRNSSISSIQDEAFLSSSSESVPEPMSIVGTIGAGIAGILLRRKCGANLPNA